jgi:hypothetical protein
MIFWSLCAFIWFRNMKKMLLQMTSGFLQLESTLRNIAAKTPIVKQALGWLTLFFTVVKIILICQCHTGGVNPSCGGRAQKQKININLPHRQPFRSK